MLLEFPRGIVCVTNPTLETVSNRLPEGTEIEKAPSLLVLVLTFVPATEMVAPATGVPLASVTLPVTVLFCANRNCASSNSPARRNSLPFFIFVCLIDEWDKSSWLKTAMVSNHLFSSLFYLVMQLRQRIKHICGMGFRGKNPSHKKRKTKH